MNQPGNNQGWGIEERVSILLKPVTPDPAFIHSLKARLNRTPELMLETSRKQINLLTVALGLVTGALLLWLIRRFKA